MKIDEAIETIKTVTDLVTFGILGESNISIALNMAIEALEKQKTFDNGTWVDKDYHDKVYALLQERYFKALESTRWIPVSERLPEIGQKVKIRRCSDYYEALYDPKNQFLPWQLIDERDGSVSALFRRREFVDEWQEM